MRQNRTIMTTRIGWPLSILLLTACVTNPVASNDTFSQSSATSIDSTSLSLSSTQESIPSSAAPMIYYIVTFDTQGGSSIPPMSVAEGTTIAVPSNPSKRYHIFHYWYVDNLSTVFDFSIAIFEDIALQAAWQVEVAPMSVLTINFNDVIENVTRETFIPALTSLTNHDNETGGLSNVATNIRGRGNGGGWGYEQKSYRLKFEQRQGLFGLTPSRHWLLVCGGHDFSLLRSHAAYTLASIALDNLEFVTSAHYVEVYFNDQYHGVYHLFEQTRVEKGRIDIPSEYDVLDTGYLIEYDSYATGVEGMDYFWVQGLRYPFSVKSPEPDDYVQVISEERFREHVMFIQDYVQDVIDALYRGDQSEIAELIDLPSWIDMYLIHELFKNTDTGWSSFFLYKKPGGKLYLGSPWDFDFSSGISRGDGTVQGLYVSDTIRYYSDFTANEMFIRLMELPFFVSLVKTRLLVFAERIIIPIADFNAIRIRYGEAFERHAVRWGWYGQWYQDQDYVRTWLASRRQWLLQWAS
jgi:hypothetical protein